MSAEQFLTDLIAPATEEQAIARRRERQAARAEDLAVHQTCERCLRDGVAGSPHTVTGRPGSTTCR